VIWKYWQASKENSCYPTTLLKFSMSISQSTTGTLRLLTSHYRQAITGTVEPSKEKRKYSWQIILFNFWFYPNKNKMK